jgi:hypothetical protein
MRPPRMVGLALALFALSAAPVFARCDPAAEPDRADIANARDAVLANCDCAGAESHGAYVRCAVDQIAAVLVNRQCRRKAKECAAKSTCGRPGAVTCCKEKHGRTKCKVAHSAAACEAKGGTAGSCSSCCDACPEPGSGPSCPASSTTTTSTTPSTTLVTSTVTSTTTTATSDLPDYCCLQSSPYGGFDTCEEMTYAECEAACGVPGLSWMSCDSPAPCEHAISTVPPFACCVADQCIMTGSCECERFYGGTWMFFQICEPGLCTTTTLPTTLVPDFARSGGP